MYCNFGKRLLVFRVCFFSLILLVSCKSKSALTTTNTNKTLTAEEIIENHYNNKIDFSTLYIKSSARYEDDKQSQNVTAEIKIKKNEKILVSIRFLGITMAKALITPKEVRYYEKINGKYFEGNYTTLSQWLGTDLDFIKVQNILIGQALDDLKLGKYNLTTQDKTYKLESNLDQNTIKKYFLQSENYLIDKQEITQKGQERTLQINYLNHNRYDQMFLPTNLIIEAIQKNHKTNISLDYNSVSFNEELSFPYSVPESFERIFIN